MKLSEAFDRAKLATKKLDNLYTPKPSDQLVMTSDYAEKGINMTAGTSAEEEWLVVARMSAELQPQQNN